MTKSVIDVNKKLLDILCVDTQKSGEFLTNVQVNITPDEYPKVIITQYITMDDKEVVTNFYLCEKEAVETYTFKGSYAQARLMMDFMREHNILYDLTQTNDVFINDNNTVVAKKLTTEQYDMLTSYGKYVKDTCYR